MYARTSTDLNLLTTLSTVHEPPEYGLKNGPKHVGASFMCFKCFNVNLVFFKVHIIGA